MSKTVQQGAEKRGFTVVELLVSTAIMMMITGMIIVRQQSFDSSVELTNVAYEVALKVRRAQSYGINVREFNAGSGNFDTAFGVNFSHEDQSQFVLFGDNDNDDTFDDDGSELVETYQLGDGYTYSVCGVASDGSEECFDTGDDGAEINALYTRPDPTATLNAHNGADYTAAEIHVQSQGGEERVVRIEQSGRVYVK